MQQRRGWASSGSFCVLSYHHKRHQRHHKGHQRQRQRLHQPPCNSQARSGQAQTQMRRHTKHLKRETRAALAREHTTDATTSRRRKKMATQHTRCTRDRLTIVTG